MILDLFETHVLTTDLDKSSDFYENILGLTCGQPSTSGIRTETRWNGLPPCQIRRSQSSEWSPGTSGKRCTGGIRVNRKKQKESVEACGFLLAVIISLMGFDPLPQLRQHQWVGRDGIGHVLPCVDQ